MSAMDASHLLIAAAHTPPLQAQAPGTVTLVGAGPGDPELLTLKAVKALQAASLVLYDHLVSPAVLAFLPPDAERVYVGKESSRHTLPQGDIIELMVRLARSGRAVLRLKGGDGYIFGRGGEEAQALAAQGIPFTVVPGLTAAQVPQRLGEPARDIETEARSPVTPSVAVAPEALELVEDLCRLFGTDPGPLVSHRHADTAFS